MLGFEKRIRSFQTFVLQNIHESRQGKRSKPSHSDIIALDCIPEGQTLSSFAASSEA